MIVLRIFVSFMATIINAHGSINFKVGVTEPYNHLSQRSSFNVWKNMMIPRVSVGTSDLGDVGLVNIKVHGRYIHTSIYIYVNKYITLSHCYQSVFIYFLF